jgi:hypothetical protein
MNANTYQGTAKIYQFPPRSRQAVADRRGSAEAVVESMPQRICDALDNCWYHDAAVQQAAGSTKS